MCFRPTSAGKPVKCPNCGTLNIATAKTCMRCKADLSPAKEQSQEENKEK